MQQWLPTINNNDQIDCENEDLALKHMNNREGIPWNRVYEYFLVYERLHRICACIYVVNGDRLCDSYMERCV
jgi:hypothetical protein